MSETIEATAPPTTRRCAPAELSGLQRVVVDDGTEVLMKGAPPSRRTARSDPRGDAHAAPSPAPDPSRASAEGTAARAVLVGAAIVALATAGWIAQAAASVGSNEDVSRLADPRHLAALVPASVDDDMRTVALAEPVTHDRAGIQLRWDWSAEIVPVTLPRER